MSFLSQEKVGRRHKLPLLRRVCQRLGVRVLSRGYKLDTIDPFALEDVVGVFPVVKVQLVPYAVLAFGCDLLACVREVCSPRLTLNPNPNPNP